MDIFTTMITPYKKDGRIDLDLAKKYVDWYFEQGLTGIFSVCQSSEIFYLSLEEKTELNNRNNIIAGASVLTLVALGLIGYFVFKKKARR